MIEEIFRKIAIDYFFTVMFAGYAIGIWGWHRAKNLRAIPMLLLLTFIAQMFMYYWAVEYKNNALIAHIFNPVQFIVLMLFFYQNAKERWMKKITIYLGAAMLIYGFINSMFLQNTKIFPSNFLVVSNLLLILLSGYLFLHKLDSVSTKVNIFKEPVFLIAAAILYFNIFSFIFFLLNNYMILNNIRTTYLRNILLLTNVMYYTILLMALIFSLKNSKTTRAKV